MTEENEQNDDFPGYTPEEIEYLNASRQRLVEKHGDLTVHAGILMDVVRHYIGHIEARGMPQEQLLMLSASLINALVALSGGKMSKDDFLEAHSLFAEIEEGLRLFKD